MKGDARLWRTGDSDAVALLSESDAVTPSDIFYRILENSGIFYRIFPRRYQIFPSFYWIFPEGNIRQIRGENPVLSRAELGGPGRAYTASSVWEAENVSWLLFFGPWSDRTAAGRPGTVMQVKCYSFQAG